MLGSFENSSLFLLFHLHTARKMMMKMARKVTSYIVLLYLTTIIVYIENFRRFCIIRLEHLS